MLRWSRLAPARWLEAWEERLWPLGPERFAIHLLPGGRTIRITAYSLTPAQGRKLASLFGGALERERAETWHQPPARPPIRIRDRLLVAGDRATHREARAAYPDRLVLLIPSEMAFGTGDHVTTASCLRWVCDLADEWNGRPWSMLDVGTGTGILAIAAARLGADRVTGLDFDPHAIRVARRNGRLNRVPEIRWRLSDITRRTPPGRHDLVAANLFSDVLQAAAPRLARATKPGGRLFVSGILNPQADATLAALAAEGFRPRQILRRGKWTTAHLGFDEAGSSTVS